MSRANVLRDSALQSRFDFLAPAVDIEMPSRLLAVLVRQLSLRAKVLPRLQVQICHLESSSKEVF